MPISRAKLRAKQGVQAAGAAGTKVSPSRLWIPSILLGFIPGKRANKAV